MAADAEEPRARPRATPPDDGSSLVRPATPRRHLVNGDVIDGRYRIESLLGEGAMGEVYVARDLDLEREVALKVLPASADGDTEAVERFMRQAPAAARANHPGIVDVHARGSHEGRPFIVMERLRGADLERRIKEYGPLPVGVAARIAGDLAHAVHAAHKTGIVHRDLKPSNVFLAQEPDGSETVKVLDFGIAKLLDSDVSLTGTGELMGTPGYMPPEQLRNSKQVDARTDVYAIGCVLYAMLTGRAPFTASDRAELTMLVMHREPTPLCELRPDVSPELENLVERAMAKEADDRIATAGLLARLLYEQAVKAGEPPPEGRRLEPLSSYPPPTVPTPIGEEAPAISTDTTLDPHGQTVRATGSNTDDAPAKRPSLTWVFAGAVVLLLVLVALLLTR